MKYLRQANYIQKRDWFSSVWEAESLNSMAQSFAMSPVAVLPHDGWQRWDCMWGWATTYPERKAERLEFHKPFYRCAPNRPKHLLLDPTSWRYHLLKLPPPNITTQRTKLPKHELLKDKHPNHCYPWLLQWKDVYKKVVPEP
jgi:hypothetical protein